MWRWGAVAICLIGLVGASLWFGCGALRSRERLFRGKPEKEWIQNLKYWDDQQVAEWRGYGEEGVQVLIRGLERADRPSERTYRKLYRQAPDFLKRRLPNAKSDSTRVTRHCIVSLLSSLGTNALSAAPIMIRVVRNDEDPNVRQSAINYFNTSEDDTALLNHLPPAQKGALLPAFIRDVQNAGNWGLRNNAAISLRYYPEQQGVVAPVLIATLQDSQPQVRQLAAEALNRIAPEAAKKAGATGVLVQVARHTNDQIAFRAVASLGHRGSQPDVAVPALIECLQNTNTLIACEAVWALQWSPPEFQPYAGAIIPALQNAAQRKENVGRYAQTALAQWQARLSPKGERK